MAGPTPVSALIHAATMVTSGVVLMNRMNIVFQLSPTASAIICAVGAFTALFAAVIAFGQTDIKKVLAYSTVSQLGFMFIACGAGAYWAGMFHVTTHAFFKALLFLGAGAVIYGMAHEQDMRYYGNLRKYMPITFLTMVIGTLAIAGVPGLAGYYSKEAMLGSALSNSHAGQVSQWAGWLGLAVAALTAMYMARLTFLTFFGKAERWRSLPVADHHGEHAGDHSGDDSGDHDHHLSGNHKPKEVPVAMWMPLAILAVLSIVSGYWLYEGNRFEHWLYPDGLAVLGELKHAYPNLTVYSMVAAIAGLLAGGIVYVGGLPAKEGLDETKWAKWRRSAGQQFGFDGLMTMLFAEGGRDVSQGFAGYVEKQVVDGAVEGSAGATRSLGQILRHIQTGAVRVYALLMLVGGVGFIAYFLMIANRGGK
jgi:NADH-quinone oxidoreductase subunit L